MFSFFKKNKTQSKGTQYSFIWYMQVRTGKTIHFTQPFRTRVTADNFAEAKEKAQNIAHKKIELIFLTEQEYNEKDPLKKVNESITGVNEKLENLINYFKTAINRKPQNDK